MTREFIALSEPVLLDVPAQIGRLREAEAGVTWDADPGSLLLTPTGLHFIESSAQHAVSYNDITVFTESSRTPRAMREWPFSKVRDYTAAIEIGTERFNCWQRCVYAMESPESAATALAIIRDSRSQLDVFGRSKGSREFWLTHILRVGPHALTWSPLPAYLEQQRPDTIAAIELMLRSDADALTRLLEEEVLRWLTETLTAETQLSGWSARRTAGVPRLQSHNPESARSRAALRAADGSVDIQVVSRNVLQFREVANASAQPSITVTVNMSLWFHTVAAPHYRGKTIEFSHSANHPEAAWLARGSSLLAAEIESAAEMMAGELAAVLRESGNTK